MSAKENRMLREFELLRVLAESETGRLTRTEIWDAVVARVPLEPDEAQATASSAMPRGEKNFQWSSAELVDAGFLIKAARGEWVITDAGREALVEMPVPDVLATRARDLSLALRNARDEMATEAMTRTFLPPDSTAAAVRRGALLFRERGLRDLGSVFSPGRKVWRAEVAAELVARVIEQPEVEGEGFLAKLQVQLAAASDDAILLVAELVAWQILPLSTPGEQKKRERITTVLGWMEHPVVLPVDVESVLRNWSFNPGVGLSTRLWHGLSLLIEAVVAWTALEEADRDALLGDAMEWRSFVFALPGDDFPTQRYELLYLVHPGTFGEIISKEHRRAIRDGFVGELPDGPSDDIDADLLAITVRLQEKANDSVEYYVDPLRSQWQPVEPTTETKDGSSTASVEPSVGQTESIREPFPPADAALADRLHLDQAWLESTLKLIERRRQVIFYGPPGTGKTFVARALADFVTKSTDGVASVVQFHPTYSYEDFFEGFRPTVGQDGQQLGFSLRPGPLRRLATEAAANPEANYFLVIDEINRGNLAKIFGELYYLLEYRDSAISLLYSEEPFTLPANIFFIGTMNTADRSIAMLDAAMRRRFAFVELHPDLAPVAGLLSRWSNANGFEDDRGVLLDELNMRIDDHDAKVGPSFLMRYFDDVRDVWRYEILPLLAEFHYADGTDVDSRYGVNALRGAVSRRAAAEATAELGQDDGAV